MESERYLSGAQTSKYCGRTENTSLRQPTRRGRTTNLQQNNNFARGTPTLPSFDGATALVHKTGHGRHGVLSDVTHARPARIIIPTDLVENY